MALKSVAGNLVLSDYREMISVMRKVQPELVRQLRKRYREIGRDIVKAIKTDIPTAPPLVSHKRGTSMITKVGRLSWSRTENQTRPLKSVVIREKRTLSVRGKRLPIVGLVQARVNAAPVALADMAGRSGRYINARAVTRKYKYTYHTKDGEFVGDRDHKINGQGRAMINQLNKNFGRRASRFIYPAAESKIPAAAAEMKVAVQKASDNLNAMLKGV